MYVQTHVHIYNTHMHADLLDTWKCAVNNKRSKTRPYMLDSDGGMGILKALRRTRGRHVGEADAPADSMGESAGVRRSLGGLWGQGRSWKKRQTWGHMTASWVFKSAPAVVWDPVSTEQKKRKWRKEKERGEAVSHVVSGGGTTMMLFSARYRL